tara:strand:+ start:223 stop:645 length:423 start_codon:yes stop_codon:yes gene_type:complete
MGISTQATQTSTGEKKEYPLLPDGDYVVTMDRVAEQATKKGDGSFVKASFKVESGDYKGRLIFTNFLINHPNPKAANIGKEQLSKCLKALGVYNGFAGIGNDSTQLESFLGKELIVNVGVEEGTNGYKDRNKIMKWIRRS